MCVLSVLRYISIHAAREGGDIVRRIWYNLTIISIHAAREGGDASDIADYILSEISIHAAREGGDDVAGRLDDLCKNFNPRRP